MQEIYVIPSKTGTHIMGHCLDCGYQHDGLFCVAIYNGMLQIGIEKDHEFHALESVSIAEIVQVSEEQNNV